MQLKAFKSTSARSSYNETQPSPQFYRQAAMQAYLQGDWINVDRCLTLAIDTLRQTKAQTELIQEHLRILLLICQDVIVFSQRNEQVNALAKTLDILTGWIKQDNLRQADKQSLLVALLTIADQLQLLLQLQQRSLVVEKIKQHVFKLWMSYGRVDIDLH